MNYVGEFEDTPDVDFDGILDFDSNTRRKVDCVHHAEPAGAVHGLRDVTLLVGLDNALDEEPPFAVGDGDTDLYGYVQTSHSPRGRFAYGKATYRF